MRLSPKRIPDLSFRVENINGNVIGVEELNMFLFDIFFKILGLYAKGRLVLKESNCLKYVFLNIIQIVYKDFLILAKKFLIFLD